MNKADFDRYLKRLDLSKKDLANLTNLSYNTINGWNGENKPYPEWLESWFVNCEKSLKFEKIKQILQDEI